MKFIHDAYVSKFSKPGIRVRDTKFWMHVNFSDVNECNWLMAGFNISSIKNKISLFLGTTENVQWQATVIF